MRGFVFAEHAQGPFPEHGAHGRLAPHRRSTRPEGGTPNDDAARRAGRLNGIFVEVVVAITRREVMVGGAVAVGAAIVGGCANQKNGESGGGAVGGIDRKTVVSRNDPVVRKLEAYSALSVGNGRFCFTGDVTGLQTFPERYVTDFPLCTMATWAWHTTPPGSGVDPSAYKFKEYEVYGRKVGYATSSTGQVPLFNWLRENPHRMYLGRVGLVLTKSDGTSGGSGDVTSILQRLDLWSGVNESRFEFGGEMVRVRTCVHPESDAAGGED